MFKSKLSILFSLALSFCLFTTGEAVIVQNNPQGGSNMTNKTDEGRRDAGGTINPSFYISHAEYLPKHLWKTNIDGETYTLTFSNISRRWINANIYKDDKINRDKMLFEGDTEMEQFSFMGNVVQITPYEKGKEFLPGYKYMVVSRDGYGVAHITMQKDSYSVLAANNPLNKIDLGAVFTDEPSKDENIYWEFVDEPNADELQYLTLTRSQPAGTGIEFIAKVEPDGYLKKTIDTVNYKHPDMPGSSGEHKWRWKAIMDGNVTITISQPTQSPTPVNAIIYHYEIKDGIIHEIGRDYPEQAWMPMNSSLTPQPKPSINQGPSWTCQACGSATQNGKFCTECGTPRPS